MIRITWLAVAALVLFPCRFVAAEVPSLPKERLTERAALVVAGRVTAVEAKVIRQGPDGSKETRHTLTVAVDEVAKGDLKDRAQPITAVGVQNVLPPRSTGSTGHRSNNTNHRLAAVEKGWELRLFLAKAGKDGAYELLFPNGFEVLKQGK